MGTRRSRFVVAKARRMGLRASLARKTYVNLGKDGDELDEDSPPFPLWTKTIHPIRCWAGRALRHDLMYITTTGRLYFNPQSRRIQYLEPRELSMVEKRENDPNDIADIFVGDKVSGKIPCLSATSIYFCALDKFREMDLTMFQELYPDYWQGLHPDIQQYIVGNEYNCDVYVNPDTCELAEDKRGNVPGGVYEVHTHLHMLTKAYWSMSLSVDEGNLYSIKDRHQYRVGFTGVRAGWDAPNRTGFFVIKIPARNSGERFKIIFMSMMAIRLMLLSYYLWMTDGSFERQADRYGLEMPREAFNDREWAWFNQELPPAQTDPGEDEPSTPASTQEPEDVDVAVDEDDDTGGEEEQPSVSSYQAPQNDDQGEGSGDKPNKKPRF